MGVEVTAADPSSEQAEVTIEDKTSIPKMDNAKLNSEKGTEEPIQFGLADTSHGVNGETKETGHMAPDNFPKDAVDEWPAPKEIHTFYFVRVRPYDDPKLKAKIDQVDKDIYKKNQARSQLIEALRAKRSERSHLISQRKPLSSENRGYSEVIEGKRKEMEPLHAALGQLRDAKNSTREKGVGLCSSEDELNALIYSLNYRIQHESNTLVEEKKMLKEIKQLEGSREKVIANAALRAKIQDSVGQKEAIQDQVKLIGGDMDEVRKDKLAVRTKLKQLDDELDTINDEIKTLEEQLDAITKKREESYASLHELRKARDDVNVRFYQNRSLLNSVKDLAAKKDIPTLEELSHSEVESFISEWSNSKDFRDDYEKRILSSLDNRQLTRDGRMRNPDERSIILPQPANEPVSIPAKITSKQAKEEAPPTPAVSTQKIQDETVKSTEVKPRGRAARSEEPEETYEIGKSKELPKPSAADVAKSKEMKREEEIAKAKLTLERKKKLAEKAAAKAATRAQKEAEKKIKEKEKRAKKKAGILEPAVTSEQTEMDAKSSEPEEAEEKPEAPVPAKTKEPKEKMKYRGRPRVADPLPKVILKRKKAQAYWSWAAPVAAAAVLAVILAVIGYYYAGMN